MSIDCEQMDGLMMDFLYQELSADGLTTFQKHMEGCARCTQELARFQGVRSAVRNIGEAEPPAGVSARLIAEAAKQVAPSPARRAWVWLAALFGPLRAHPALASVAALALVIGVGGFLARRGFEGKKPEGTQAAIDDRMAESASAGAGAPSASPAPAMPMEAASAGAAPEAMMDGVDQLNQNQAPGAGGKAAPLRGQAGADQGSFEFSAKAEEANKEAEAQRKLAAADKTMADKSGAADGDADAERVARLRSTPVVVSGEGGASKPGDLAAATKDSKSDTEAPRFATPPPAKPAPDPVKRPTVAPAPSPSPMAAVPKTPRAAPTDDADGFANGDDEMAPPPGMVAPSGGMPPTMASPDVTAGRNSTVAAPAPTTGTGSVGGLGNAGPAPKQVAPTKGKVTVTSKPAGSPPVSNPMNLRDPKPMTPSQMQASADVKRRRGDCVGALPMYDEILRKYPSYAGKAAVTAGRETCLNELEGKLARKKSGGSSSAGSKAKAAPMPAREADMATDPASSK